MIPLVLYHANCPDGFCAAWVARRSLGPGAEFVAVNYGQPPPDVAGREVYILDFSYPRRIMLGIVASARKLVLLDHHETAVAELSGWDFQPPPEAETPFIRLENGISGGHLAWEYFNPTTAPPWLVEYTEDRDLWAWKLPESRAINAGLALYPREFEVWDRLHESGDSYFRLAREGATVLRYQQTLIDSIVKGAREYIIGGHKILAANTSVLFSEVAEKLAEGRAFGAAWFVRGDGVKQWSLRSREGGVNVADVARSRGGGGHAGAAGFQGEAD